MLFISSKKLLSSLRYLNIFPDFNSHTGKRHDKKAKVNIKFYDVMNWERIRKNWERITIHTLSNTSRSKDNQTIKFSKLAEYSVRNIFL